MAEISNMVEALSPAQIAEKTEQIGVYKANSPLYKTVGLSMLAGAFIALGGLFYITTTTDLKVGYGIQQLLGGLVFCVGLILVLIAGAELFTGNTLLSVAYANRKITLWQLLRNWLLVFFGNFAGALIIVGLAIWAQHWTNDNYLVGAKALYTGASKASLPIGVAFARAILCNLLVCLAVWLSYGGRTVADKIAATLFPVTAFVALGFEHSVANMFFIPYAIWLKGQPEVVAAANLPAAKLAHLTWGDFLMRLGPVTLGNIIGGAVMVGAAYWFIYLRGHEAHNSAEKKSA